jgi:hypothetical protein
MKEHGIGGQKQIAVIECYYALRPHPGIERTTTVFPTSSYTGEVPAVTTCSSPR